MSPVHTLPPYFPTIHSVTVVPSTLSTAEAMIAVSHYQFLNQKHSPSDANSHSASQDIFRLLWNPKVHYRVQKSPPLVRIMIDACSPRFPTQFPLRSILISSHLGGCIQKFPDWVITKETTINTHWEVTQGIMEAKLTRLTHEVPIQLHLLAESYTIYSSRSRRLIRKLLVTPPYTYMSLKWSLPFRISGQNFSLHFLCLLCLLHAPLISSSFIF
jgi:hypothetical protein